MRSQGGDNQPASKERPRLPDSAAWNRNCGRIFYYLFSLIHALPLCFCVKSDSFELFNEVLGDQRLPHIMRINDELP